jgi:preprotein translocase SecF subunit
VFHLTKYKYWFFGISLAIILPGLLALAVWHLNLGIDFTGGSTVDLSFARAGVTTEQIKQVFHQAGAQDVGVYTATNLNGGLKPGQLVYITLDHAVDTNVVNTIIQRLGAASAHLPPNPQLSGKYMTAVPGSNNTRGVVVVQFGAPVTDANAVKSALQNLPATSAVTVTGQPTATPASKATPTATSTPSASSGSSSPTTTYPVSVQNVEIGANNLVYEVDTQTSFNTGVPGSKSYIDLNAILYTLDQKFGSVYSPSQQNVGPAIASQTTFWAFMAVVFASVAITLYIGYAFRHVGSIRQALRFGVSAIIALLHDALVVLGLWAIFGHFFNFKVDSLFLTAILTVIGFSVHDTIVVFDRIRENLRRRTSESFETVVNASLVQTMSRSLNTSLTVLLTLAALTLFGGATIQQFTLALLIGIMSGTYSSIFNASMILTVWETREYRTWFRRRPQTTALAPRARRALAETRA